MVVFGWGCCGSCLPARPTLSMETHSRVRCCLPPTCAPRTAHASACPGTANPGTLARPPPLQPLDELCVHLEAMSGFEVKFLLRLAELVQQVGVWGMCPLKHGRGLCSRWVHVSSYVNMGGVRAAGG